MSDLTSEPTAHDIHGDVESGFVNLLLWIVALGVIAILGLYVWAYVHTWESRTLVVCGAIVVWWIWATKPPGWSWWRHLNSQPARVFGPLALVVGVLVVVWLLLVKPVVVGAVHSIENLAQHPTSVLQSKLPSVNDIVRDLRGQK